MCPQPEIRQGAQRRDQAGELAEMRNGVVSLCVCGGDEGAEACVCRFEEGRGVRVCSDEGNRVSVCGAEGDGGTRMQLRGVEGTERECVREGHRRMRLRAAAGGVSPPPQAPAHRGAGRAPGAV